MQIQNPKIYTPPKLGEAVPFKETYYYIGEYINEGTFGSVCQCQDEWGNQLVAKILKPNNQTYEQIKYKWEHELNNLVQLRHPNVTYIHSAFEYRDTFYLIIEKCDFTLNELRNMQNFNTEIWLPYIAKDILHGLYYIHQWGYVHKDLHMGNIFQDSNGSFKIGDFGISNIEGNIRFFNTILADWMLPPESLNPYEFGVVGKHTDIYHIGLLFLSLLLNKNLNFTNEEILSGKPRKIAENLQSPYSYVIAKALRRHVGARTQSAIEMWRDIRNVIQ